MITREHDSMKNTVAAREKELEEMPRTEDTVMLHTYLKGKNEGYRLAERRPLVLEAALDVAVEALETIKHQRMSVFLTIEAMASAQIQIASVALARIASLRERKEV